MFGGPSRSESTPALKLSTWIQPSTTTATTWWASKSHVFVGSVTRAQTNFHVCTSSAQPDGSLGVESWIAKRLVRDARVRPRAHSPRLLSVLVGSPQLSFVHVVGHAPTSLAPADEREQFWTALRKEITSLGRRRYVFLSIDANGAVGNVESAAIPRQHDVEENDYGAAMRTMLERTHLSAASADTLQAGATWYGGRNQREGRSIDYVCTSASLNVVSAGVDTRVHPSGKDAIDNVVVFCTVRAFSQSARGGRDVALPRLSRSLIESPEAQHQFQRYLWGGVSCSNTSGRPKSRRHL